MCARKTEGAGADDCSCGGNGSYEARGDLKRTRQPILRTLPGSGKGL
jgi:hypothetical protein